MSDLDVIRFLLRKHDKSPAQLAEALGVPNAQNVIHWRTRRRISPAFRFKVFQLANKLGAHLPITWLEVRKPRKEKTNGRTRHAAKARQRNGKRQKPKGGKPTPRKGGRQGSQRAAV